MRSKSGPGGTLYRYGLCELAQRQAVLLRQDNPSDRAIKSDRAKVVMTAGCISRIFDITNYIYNSRESGNSTNQDLPNKVLYIIFHIANAGYTKIIYQNFSYIRR